MTTVHKTIELGKRTISEFDPCYIIAEIGVNHDGSLEKAFKLVDAAAASGADAVKFQTFLVDEMVRKDTQQAEYQKRNLNEETSQSEMLKKLELPFEDFEKLSVYCTRKGVDFISTAFDPMSLSFIASLKPVCFKWASGELTNKPLLLQAASYDTPILLSTGMGQMSEIEEATTWIGEATPFVLLQCVSDYPAAPSDQNLRVLRQLAKQFGCPVGFSDHTIGPTSAIAARALGMSVLEKHFTLDKNSYGPDHRASEEPKEFRAMVDNIRLVETALGDGKKRVAASEISTSKIARKSLVYRSDLTAGHVLSLKDISAKRPNGGLLPKEIDGFLGKALLKPVFRDDFLAYGDIGKDE